MAEEINYIEYLENVVGRKWIIKKLKQAQNRSYSPDPFNPAAPRALMKTHPIIDAYLQAANWNARMRSRRLLFNPKGKETAFLTMLGRDLYVLNGSYKRDEIAKRLKSNDGFEHVKYELFVAAGFKLSGYDIEFVPTSKIKTHDLNILLSNAKKVLVECKKKSPINELDEYYKYCWTEFNKHIMPFLIKEDLNYLVYVKPIQKANHADMKSLASETIRALKNGKGDFGSKDNKYKVTFTKLAEKDGFITKSDYWEKTKKFPNACHSTKPKNINPRELNQNNIYNPKVVGFDRGIDFSLPPDVIDVLKRGAEQINGDYPAIIYVDLSLGPREWFDKFTGQLINEMKKKTSFGNANAIVFTRVILEQDAKGNAFFSHVSSTAVFTKVKNSLPLDFKIFASAEPYSHGFAPYFEGIARKGALIVKQSEQKFPFS